MCKDSFTDAKYLWHNIEPINLCSERWRRWQQGLLPVCCSCPVADEASLPLRCNGNTCAHGWASLCSCASPCSTKRWNRELLTPCSERLLVNSVCSVWYNCRNIVRVFSANFTKSFVIIPQDRLQPALKCWVIKPKLWKLRFSHCKVDSNSYHTLPVQTTWLCTADHTAEGINYGPDPAHTYKYIYILVKWT